MVRVSKMLKKKTGNECNAVPSSSHTFSILGTTFSPSPEVSTRRKWSVCWAPEWSQLLKHARQFLGKPNVSAAFKQHSLSCAICARLTGAGTNNGINNVQLSFPLRQEVYCQAFPPLPPPPPQLVRFTPQPSSFIPQCCLTWNDTWPEADGSSYSKASAAMERSTLLLTMFLTCGPHI